jgi:hypothetical protein
MTPLSWHIGQYHRAVEFVVGRIRHDDVSAALMFGPASAPDCRRIVEIAGGIDNDLAKQLARSRARDGISAIAPAGVG